MNILITGFPGTGKSAIAHELARRGHRAYDPETMRGYTHVESRATGARIHSPKPTPSGWFDTIGAQIWDPVKLHDLLDEGRVSGDVFVCGMAHNLDGLRSLFQYVFVLTLDDTDLEKRLLSRPHTMFGRTADERSDVLRLHREFEAHAVAHGATPLNSGHGTHELVDEILKTIVS